MGKQLEASVDWSERLHFEGSSAYAHRVPIDHSPPLGDGCGIKPTELTLMSLAACGGQTVISLLEKMKQDVHSFRVTAAGKTRDEHPQVFTEIHLEFRLAGAGLNAELVEKAVRLTEEKYCPVWAMLKPAVRITSAILIS